MKSQYLFVLFLCLLASFVSATEISKIEEHYERGKSYINMNQYLNAINTCKAGIQLLGENYYPNQDNKMIDDTGLKILAAEYELKNKKESNSANLYCKMLGERISMYKKYTQPIQIII